MAHEQAGSPKSSPDAAKLSSMSKRIMTVTKMRKGVASSLVIPYWEGPNLEQIMQFQGELPAKFGAGVYRFEVTDTTSNEKDAWTVQIGDGMPDVPQAAPPPTFPAAGYPGAGVHAGGDGSGSTDIGHGFVYNETLGLLTTPQRQIFEWRPGQPLPGSLGSPSSWYGAGGHYPPPASSTLPPGANVGWGSMPVNDVDKQRLQMLEAQLAAEREARKDDARKEELKEIRDSFTKVMTDTNDRFEKLVAKIAEKPAGPSAESEALKRELEETKRLVSAQAAAAETARREDALRAEIKGQADRTESLIREIKDAAGRQPDPMIPLLGQIMTTQQASSTAMVQAMKETAAIQASASKENADAVAQRLAGAVLTPERMLEVIKLAKDRTPDAAVNQGMIDMFKQTFGMAQEVVKMQADLYNQSQGPAWVPFAQQAVDQIGRVASMYVQKKAQADSEADATAKEDEVAARRQEAQARAQSQQAAARRAAQPQPQRPAPPREPTAQEIRDAAARHVYGGADTVAPPPAAAPPAAAPAPARAAAPAPPAPAAEPARKRRARKPPADGKPDLSKAPTADVKAITDNFSDEDFFGPFHSQVLRLRSEAEGGLGTAEAANAILMSRQYFQAYGGELPPAIEVLNSGHVDIVVDRLLPDADEEYRAAVTEAVRAQLGSASAEAA